MYLLAHPTRGVDVGAIETIHQHILSLLNETTGVLVFSAELPELLALCDRILVLYEGQCVGERLAHETQEAELGFLMTGGGSREI